jgi:hypothetical protein
MPKDSLKDRIYREVRLCRSRAIVTLPLSGKYINNSKQIDEYLESERQKRQKTLLDQRRRRNASADATTISGSRFGDDSIQTAFDAFGLDPTAPSDWRTLLAHLARISFPPKKKIGRSKSWDGDRYVELLQDFAGIKNLNPGISAEKTYRILSKHPKYSNIKSGTIKKVYHKARDPNANPDLHFISKELLSHFGHVDAVDKIKQMTETDTSEWDYDVLAAIERACVALSINWYDLDT